MEAKRIVFPLELDGEGSLISKSEDASIVDSIMSILSFPIDTIPFHREYGSNLYKLRGIPNNSIVSQLAKFYTIEAISTHDRRLQLLECKIIQEDDQLTILTRYLALKSQLSNSLNILLT